MRIVSYQADDGRTGVAAVIDEALHDLTDALGLSSGGPVALSPMRQLLSSGDLPTLSSLVGQVPVLSRDGLRLLAPVPDPSKIIAAPVNYRDHKAEMKQDVHISSMGLFLKAPSSIVGHQDTVQLPYTDRRFDQEGELAVVIGKSARHVSENEALQYVAGYTCLLDLTMRGGEDRSTRKSFDGFTPLGPELVTVDEVGDIGQLELRCWVGGTLRQWTRLSDLIWDVPKLVSYASSVMTLHPGDVIATGTPAGVGEISDGDQIDVEISQIGRLSVTADATDAVACPTLGANSGPVPPPVVTPVDPRAYDRA